jgi:hypothetical protein
MPQASDELRAKMKEYFKNETGIEDQEPIAYLKSRGLDYDGDFVYRIPADKAIDSKDINCLNFMVDEWDFDWQWKGLVR